MKIFGLLLLGLGVWFFVIPLAAALWSVAGISLLLGGVAFGGGALALGAGKPIKALMGSKVKQINGGYD